MTLKDGRALAQKVRQAVGRGSAGALPAAPVEAKFLDCASHVLSAGAARDVLGTLHRLEGGAAVGSVAQVMVP